MRNMIISTGTAIALTIAFPMAQSE